MRISILGTLAMSVFFSNFAAIAVAIDAKDEAIKKDRKQLEGIWRVVDLKINGNQGGDDASRKISVVIGPDGAWSLRLEDKEVGKGTSTIDPSKSPKTIELTPTEGEDKDKQSPGIYEINENTFKVCIGPPERDRPTEFNSIAGYEHLLVTLEREKK